jgi:two-component system copper resistance phosphate regulon response regulator CusR
MKILVVEDSQRLRESLSEGLTRSGFAVDAVADGQSALNYAAAAQYDALVLDLMLPVRDGLSVLNELRSTGCTSRVLILSARDQLQDRVHGLELGADDYLVKPFAFDELVARLKALVRREYQQPNPLINLGEVELNTALHSVRVGGSEVQLTPHEVSLLEALALNRGKVLSVQSLEDRLYNFSSPVTHNTIEVHISKLRKKLREQGVSDVVKTRRGFGYFIEAE